MASAAQIEANRLNARKSTGPRTPEGKERASRNALKHGLLAREAVIQGEDPQEYELHRDEMLGELAPIGPVETMLAERVVGLSWRLLRAERLQNAAFVALDEGEPAELLEARHEGWKQLRGDEWDRSLCAAGDGEAALARVVVEDFAETRVLERLLMYERRLESSLYRTMAQLRKQQAARTAAAQGTSHREGRPSASQEPAAPSELGSFGAKRKGVSSGKGEVPREEDSTSGGAAAEASREPGGSTLGRTNCDTRTLHADGNHGRPCPDLPRRRPGGAGPGDARAAGTTGRDGTLGCPA
jgi:hypothetical protein